MCLDQLGADALVTLGASWTSDIIMMIREFVVTFKSSMDIPIPSNPNDGNDYE